MELCQLGWQHSHRVSPLLTKRHKCSWPSWFPIQPHKCHLLLEVVSVEQGTRSKYCNTRKPLLLMHLALSLISLFRIMFKCVFVFFFFVRLFFSKLAIFLIQLKQRSLMQKPSLTLPLSLDGRIPIFNSGQTEVRRNNLLCDLVALL